MIKLCLVDDHELLLRGLAVIIETQNDFKVVHTCASAQEVVDFVATAPEIDILMLDVNLPDSDPEELLTNIRAINPSLPIINLTILRGSRTFHRLQKLVFQGYLLKETSFHQTGLRLQTR